MCVCDYIRTIVPNKKGGARLPMLILRMTGVEGWTARHVFGSRFA